MPHDVSAVASLAVESAPRVWVLALPLDDGHGRERFDFYRSDSADGSPASTPFLGAARPFATAGEAYRFANHREELQNWVVVGNPRLTIPRFRGWARWLVAS